MKNRRIWILVILLIFCLSVVSAARCEGADAGKNDNVRKSDSDSGDAGDNEGGLEAPEEKSNPEDAVKQEEEKQEEEPKKEYMRKTERRLMVESQIQSRGVSDKKVLEAMKQVPRHLFVPDRMKFQAYDDNPLPIGYGQTISQPYIVGLMTELLKLDEDSRALEIGTGSGYQAAVLAEITDDVFTIEIVKELHQSSTKTLKDLGYDKVKTKHADGFYGWEEYAPFDAVIVTAAADHIPPPLIKQLKEGGRMCIPVGTPNQVQHLVLVKKDEEGKISTENVLSVRFVPLTRMAE